MLVRLGGVMRTVDYNSWRMEHVLQEEADLRQRSSVGSKVGGGLDSPRPGREEEMSNNPRITMSGLRTKMSAADWYTAPEMIKLFGVGGRLPGSSLANVVRGCAYALVQAKIAEVRQRPPGRGGGRPSLEFKLRTDATFRPTPGEMTTKEAKKLHPPVELKEKCMSRRITRRTAMPVAPAVPKENMATTPDGTKIDDGPMLRWPVTPLMSITDIETLLAMVKLIRERAFPKLGDAYPFVEIRLPKE